MENGGIWSRGVDMVRGAGDGNRRGGLKMWDKGKRGLVGGGWGGGGGGVGGRSEVGRVCITHQSVSVCARVMGQRWP